MPQILHEWLELLERRHHKAIDLGLERVGEVWQRMGKPRPAERIFVVGGTNGKGSTVATLCSLLGALGYSHGNYTSPHIHRYNERVQINGVNVTDRQLIESFERVEAARGDTSLSYFEFGTLAAFDILSREQLDFAVMEIGLGGRLDAVNLLDADCSIITPIGLDHQEYLGNSLELIGREKAGIIRASRPLICGEADPPSSIVETAEASGAPLLRLGVDFNVKPVKQGMRFTAGDIELDLPAPVLPGMHQYRNAATALAALFQLLPDAVRSTEAIRKGIESVRLTGRLQQVASRPAVWVDVGHNLLGATVIADAIAAQIEAGHCRKMFCVLAMLADKDATAVATALRPVISAWHVAGLQGDRGQDGRFLAQRMTTVVDAGVMRVYETVADALDGALAEASEEDGVLVFGSFLTADQALESIGRRKGKAFG
jgi:dihydrofolate synthase/folylpolyglutamate synthase